MAASGDLQRRRRRWDQQASSYDKQMGFWDRELFRDTREWVCRQARGDVRELVTVPRRARP